MRRFTTGHASLEDVTLRLDHHALAILTVEVTEPITELRATVTDRLQPIEVLWRIEKLEVRLREVHRASPLFDRSTLSVVEYAQRV
jgi:hypothetical protein